VNKLNFALLPCETLGMHPTVAVCWNGLVTVLSLWNATCRLHLYGDIYSSPGLNLRQKQLLMVAFLGEADMHEQLFGHLLAVRPNFFLLFTFILLHKTCSQIVNLQIIAMPVKTMRPF
jgi:hypothetical protein